jgi:8-oxo-dGTP diphosphatase
MADDPQECADTPGGALHPDESPADGALREAGEELGLGSSQLTLGQHSVDDHGGWSYTTVLAVPAGALEPADLRLNSESTGVAWVPLADPGVPLHPGLAASLDTLRPLLD